MNIFEQLKTITKGDNYSIDIAVNLKINVKKPENNLRFPIILPHGSSTQANVVVFADEPVAHATKSGGDDLVEQFKQQKKINADFVLTTPTFLPKLALIARILGTKGLMPKQSLGTVDTDLPAKIALCNSGRFKICKIDKGGCIQCAIGSSQLTNEQLTANISYFLHTLKKKKPVGHKGVFILAAYCSTTQSKGSYKLNLAEFE